MREVGDAPGVADAVAAATKRLQGAGAEAEARGAVEALAQLAATAALSASAPSGVAAAFARTRLVERRSAIFGASHLSGEEIALLIGRALPA